MVNELMKKSAGLIPGTFTELFSFLVRELEKKFINTARSHSEKTSPLHRLYILEQLLSLVH